MIRAAIALLLIILSSPCPAEIHRYKFVKSVTFVGNRSIPSSELRDYLGIKKGDIYSEEKVRERLERIEELYRERGFVFMRVLRVQPWTFDDEVILKIEIDEGIIGRIEVVGNVRTRADVIKRELLFKEGDPYNEEDAEESERILRSRSYLGDAEITARFDEGIDAVAVTVRVTDLWAIFPSISIPLSDGNSKLILALYDMNLLGLGQSVALRYERRSGEEGVRYKIGGSFSDPRLFGTHWHLSASYFSQPIGNSWRLSLVRPLYSLKTKWSTEMELMNLHVERAWYEDGRVGSRYDHSLSGWRFALTRSTGTRRRYTRASIWFAYREDKYSPIWIGGAEAPFRDQREGALGLSLTRATSAFVQDRFIDKLGEVEDIELGDKYRVSLRRSDRLFGGDFDETRLSLVLSSARRLREGRDYLRARLVANARLKGTYLENPIISAEAKYLARLPFGQTVALRAAYRYGIDPRRPAQILLGGNNGLRGYPRNGFSGDGVAVLNLEDRTVIFKSRYIVVGIVLFADVGCIWREGSREIYRSVGGGLRVGLPRLNGSPVYRFDLGYPLDGRFEPRLNRSISFGMGHVF